MHVGNECEHLKDLIKSTDFKGADISLQSGELSGEAPFRLPYPSFAWRWIATQSYKWRYEQHINLLEFIACLHVFRAVARDAGCHSSRRVHVLDSRVVSAVLAKGS